MEVEVEVDEKSSLLTGPHGHVHSNSITYRYRPYSESFLGKRIPKEVLLGFCLVVAWFGWSLTYRTLGNVSANMLTDPKIEITRTEVGYIEAAGFAATVPGKFVGGLLVDRFGGRRTYISALLLVAACEAAFGFSRCLMLWMISYGFKKFFAGPGWAFVVDTVKIWFHEKNWGAGFAIVGVTSASAQLIGGWMIGFLLKSGFCWNEVVWCLSVACAFLTLVLYILFPAHRVKPDSFLRPIYQKEIEAKKKIEKDRLFFLEQETNAEKESEKIAESEMDVFFGKSLFQAVIMMFTNAAFVFVVLAYAGIFILHTFSNWMPLLLSDNFGVSAGEASQSASYGFVGQILSSVLIFLVYDKLSKKVQKIFVLTQMIILASVYAAIYFIVSLQAEEQGKSFPLYIGALLSISMIHFCKTPLLVLTHSEFSARFGKSRAGLCVAFIDGCGYLFATGFNYMSGWVIDRYGWKRILFVVSVVALYTVLMLGFHFFFDNKLDKSSKKVSLPPKNIQKEKKTVGEKK